MAYIGIDLHSNRFTCNNDGNKNMTKTYPLVEEGMERFYKDIGKGDYVVLEATTNSFEFYDRIRDRVKEVYIVNPNKIKMISATSKKTDKVDALKLRKLLKYHVENDGEFLPTVYVPEKGIRELRTLYTSYKIYKKQITQMKNRIHSLLRQSLNGSRYGKREIGEKFMKDIRGDERVDKFYKDQVEILYESINMLEGQAEKIKEKIMWLGRKYQKDIDILTSVDGISVFVALGIISDYGEIERFRNAKKFASYLRSVPRVDGSNDRVYIGKTKKDGRRLTIGLLLQSLYHVTKRDSLLRRFYIKKQKGKSRGKVRMAVVRKLLVAIYYMLKERKYYRYMNKENHQRKMREYERFLEKYEKNLESS